MNGEQKLLLELLLKLDKFFNDNDITYYIDGGTAIGAIRHNGFLPWDDDADVYVTRDNYEKLLKVADKLSDIGVVLGCYELHKEYSKTAAKFTDLNDTSFVRSDAFHGLAMGQNIDIFILDPVPKNKIDEYYDYFNTYSELLTYNYLVNPNIINHINVYKKYEEMMKKEGREKTLACLLEKFTSYEENESEYYALRWGQIPVVYKKEIFGKPKMLEFEGYMLPAPERVEDFLRTQFGDGWKYVPEMDDQVTHEIYVNHDVCGINYFEDFKKFVDLESAEEILKARKKYWIERLPQQFKTEKAKRKFFDILFEMTLNDIWQNNDCDTLFKQKQYSSLLEILKEIESYGRNFSDGRKVYQSCKDILDKVLYVWSIGGKHFTAYKYIEAMGITENDGALAADYIKICDVNHRIYILIENRDYDDLKKLICENENLFDEDIEIIRAQIEIIMNENEPDLDKAESLCEKGLRVFKNDGELMKYKGDVELSKGNEAEAIAIYRNAVKNTRNGLIWLELKKKYGIEAEV